MQRRTRIVATLGPATDRPGVLEQLIDAGLDVARINFSHGSAQEHQTRIQHLRQVAEARKRNVAVLADLPGPKLRALIKSSIELAIGSELTIARNDGAAANVTVTEPEALAKIAVGQRVLLDDGRLQGRVSKVTSAAATIVIEVGGTLLPNKGINLPDTDLDIPAVTERDRAAVAIAVAVGVDWLGLSFVRDPSAADELRKIAANVPILAKMERPEAVQKSIAIIDAFDGIMVARGDLGVEIALEKVPQVQKHLIELARRAGKPVITATDMLDSMRQNPRPTRAEASDVANAVYDGSDAVMLSGETAAGTYPVESLTCMDRIVCEAEQQFLSEERLLPVPRGSLMDHLTHMLCDLAGDIGADAIITPTITGRTARLVARHRPRFDIVAVATSDAVVRQLSVVWGVEAVPFPFPVEPGADRLAAAARAAYLGKAVPQGALALILAAHPVEGGAGVPTIRVVRIGADGEPREP
jgi:pyruvate kinase